MPRLGLSWLLAALLAGWAAPARAAPASVAAAEAEAEAARADVERLAERHRALARRVDAAKRAGTPAEDLEPLLARSVAVEAALARADARRRETAASLARACRRRIAAIDDEIRERAPRLREGPLAARRRAAHAIQALREERAELRATLEAAAPHPEGQRWAAHAVRAEPLDGPEELLEKADFVEDARDKLREKRAALAELAASARRARRIARAAEAFEAESRLFDEATRPGRVVRGTRPAANPDDAPENPVRADQDPAAPSDDGARAGPELGAGSEFGRGATDGDELGAAPPGQAPAPSTAAPTVEVTVRDLGRLMEVDPARLDPASASPEAVEDLLEQLEAADAELARAAQALRARAERLAR